MDILLLSSAPLLGLIIGLLPGVGVTLSLILLWPILILFDPITLLVFYSMVVTAKEFSGSVSALNFGLMGEVTSAPAIKERPVIIRDGYQYTALKNTAIGSILGALFSLSFLYIIISNQEILYTFFKSSTVAIIIFLTLLMLIWWTLNKWYTNIILIIVGIFIGMIGYEGTLETNFLTFGNSYMAGGIPTIPFLLGVYALPCLLENLKQKTQLTSTISLVKKTIPINFSSVSRASVLGFICGLIPYVGSVITSNIAHMVEGFFYKKQDVESALNRLVAAETANNASQVSILIPFVLLGIALQTSELILSHILDYRGWLATRDFNSSLLLSLCIGIMISCVVSYMFCFTFVKSITEFFSKYNRQIFYFLVSLMVINIFNLGFHADQSIYYLLIFLISGIVGILIKSKIDLVPLLVGFLLQEKMFAVSDILWRLYIK